MKFRIPIGCFKESKQLVYSFLSPATPIILFLIVANRSLSKQRDLFFSDAALILLG